MTDLLIVGAGLAGMCCAQAAKRRGFSFHIIDEADAENATTVSGGIINPITGRKYRPEEDFEKRYTAAVDLYRQMETDFSISILTETSIFKIHKSEEALEAWLISKRKHGTPPHISEDVQTFSWQRHLDTRYGAIWIENGIRIDTRALSMAWKKSPEFIQGKIHYNNFIINDDHIVYGDVKYRHVLFCEGSAVLKNPWFQFLNMRISKGESLIVRIPYLQCDNIIQKHQYLVPLGDALYWAGGTNAFTGEHPLPTAEGKHDLESALRNTVKLPFEILEHRAALRPTVRDRRPILGTHPKYRNMHIVNGLGTKGSQLAPLLATACMAMLADGEKPDKTLAPERFLS